MSARIVISPAFFVAIVAAAALGAGSAAAQTSGDSTKTSGGQSTAQPAAKPQPPAEGFAIPPFPPNPRVDKAKKEAEQRRREYEEAVAASNGAAPASADAPAPPSAGRSAQVAERYELFAGYAVLHDGTDGVNFPLGWAASISGALTEKIGFVGQVSGAYKSYDVLGTQVASASVHMFTAGPQWSRRFPNGVKAFGQAQAGLAVGRATAFGASDSSGALAIVPGGGADLPFMKGFDLRVGAEVPFVHDDIWWKGFRFMTGIVVRR